MERENRALKKRNLRFQAWNHSAGHGPRSQRVTARIGHDGGKRRVMQSTLVESHGALQIRPGGVAQEVSSILSAGGT